MWIPHGTLALVPYIADVTLFELGCGKCSRCPGKTHILWRVRAKL